MQRISSFFPPLALLVALGALGACSDGGGSKKEPLDAGDDGGGSAVDEPDAGSDEVDAEGPCVPQGCEEQGFECGMATDGCGNELDCTGVKVCDFPEVCGPDNRCGCTPKTCDELSSLDGAQACGLRDDGCGGQIECGGCEGFTGDRWTCSTGVCACPAASAELACAGRACGTVSDGCGGGTIDCGSCGSAAQACSDNGACECKSNAEYAATACAGKSCGTVTVDGCPYTCGAPCANVCGGGQNCKTAACECAGGTACNAAGTCCAPDANPCAGKPCGTEVVDSCTGARTVCGCPSGQACVEPRYVLGATGNRCVTDSQASVLGAYAVRTHAFQKFLFSGLQRAETVSRVRIVLRQDGALELQDQGCVASTLSDSGSTRSIAPAYFNVPATRAPFSATPSTLGRVGAGPEPAGFSPQRPSFCGASGTVPASSPDYPAYASSAVDALHVTPSSGSAKAWLDGRQCTCATASCTGSNWDSCLPALNRGSAANATDCRLNDVDEDGLPGFTAIGTTDGSTSTVVAGVSVGKTDWTNGQIVVSGFHTAESPADPNFRQSFVSCASTFLGGVGCSALSTTPSQACQARFNRVQFTRLAPAQDTDSFCSQFYSAGLTTVAASTSWAQISSRLNQAAVDAYFNGTNRPSPSADFPSCNASAECPAGMLCKSSKCYPKTSPNACTTLNSNRECGAGWMCRTSSTAPYTCWPESLEVCTTNP